MLSLNDIKCRIAGRLILDGASCFVPAGHKVGLVGRNGSGKTTLFRLICGELEAENGTIAVPRNTRIGRVAQEAPAGPDTLLDVVLAAHTERAGLMRERERATDPHRIAEIETRLSDIGAHSAPARAAAILAGLGFGADDIHRPCSDFSGGWRMRVALAAILFAEPDLLLLDEPTNYLDLEGALWLENFLERYPHTVLLISHDRDLLNRAVDQILHLERGRLTLYTGGFDRFQEQRALALEQLRAAKTKIDARRAHMQAFVDRFRYKESKARQAQSRLKALSKLQPIVLPEDEAPSRIVFPEAQKLSPPLLTMSGVSTGYGAHLVLNNLTLRIDPEDRIALLGKNGNGKSTFAKLLAQRLAAMGGETVRAPKLKVGYFAQHQLDELNPQGTPLSHMAARMPSATETQVRARCGYFGFGVEKVLTRVESLSGGEKAKLLFALAMFEAPQLIILDEPTNHLDIEAREALMEAINGFDGAVIIISHDRHLLETTTDQLWLVDSGKVAPFEGDLDDYEDYVLGRTPKRRAEPEAEKLKPVETVSNKDKRRQAADKRIGLAPLKKTADAAERVYTKASAELGAVNAALADPKTYADGPARSAELQKKRGDALKAVAAAEAAWLEALEAYETEAAKS